jgi:hypothetical protein
MNNATKVKRIPVCPRCGSDNVAADAAARWNPEQQEWEVSNIFDKGHGCEDCGAEDIEFAWIDDQALGARVSAPTDAIARTPLWDSFEPARIPLSS